MSEGTDVHIGDNRSAVCRDISRTSDPSIAIVTAIAEAVDTDPTELPPLHYTIDLEALDRLLDSASSTDLGLRIGFTVEGVDVVVADGEVTVYT